LLESLGLRFVRFSADAVERSCAHVVERILHVVQASSPSPLVGEGDRGGEGDATEETTPC
jgi:hypothetical protein